MVVWAQGEKVKFAEGAHRTVNKPFSVYFQFVFVQNMQNECNAKFINYIIP
jgi:hypothetical protein